MKKDKMIISIPEPCTENWDEMTPADRGRFCASCQKTVIDFSTFSDREIINVFKAAKDNIPCGRFHTSQLDREFVITKPVDRLGLILLKRIAASLFVFQTMAMSTLAQAVRPKTSQQTTAHKKQLPSIRLIKGTVIDHVTKRPLYGMRVTLYELNISDTTDANGRFTLQLPDAFLKKNAGITVSYTALSGKEPPGSIILYQEVEIASGKLVTEIIIPRYPREINNPVVNVGYAPPLINSSPRVVWTSSKDIKKIAVAKSHSTTQVREDIKEVIVPQVRSITRVSLWKRITAPFRKRK